MDNREGGELSWYPSWSKSLWQDWVVDWCIVLVDLIWRVLASSDWIFSWTPLKPQHSNPNPRPSTLANQLWCMDFHIPPTALIIPNIFPAFLESLLPLRTWCSIHAIWSKLVWSIPNVPLASFQSLKHNFIAYRSSKVSSRPDCILEFTSCDNWVYFNSCCSYSFEPGIIKIVSHWRRCITIT